MVLQRVPVEEITTEARQVRPGRTLLTLIAAVLYGVGWLAGTVLGALWLALAWSGTAVRVGWRDAHRPRVRG